MWAGGPPKPMQPILPHSLTISPGLGRALGDSITATYSRGEP